MGKEIKVIGKRAINIEGYNRKGGIDVSWVL
jgi:hypothetical protein